MSFVVIFSISAAISAIGMVIIIARHLPRVRALSQDEFQKNFIAAPSAHSEFFENFIAPAGCGIRNFCVPRFLGIFEKAARRGRIATLRAETRLHWAANYLRGKRELATPNSNGKNSEYWTSVAEHKNGDVDVKSAAQK